MQTKYNKIPSKEFIDELIYRVRQVGWSVDMVETCDLVNVLCEHAGVPKPDWKHVSELNEEEGL
jgi:hypothetical protein